MLVHLSQLQQFLARDVIYTSCAYATMSVSVCLSVTEVHWRIIANLGFKFRSHFTAHWGAVLLAGGSSRAMLASARLSCCFGYSMVFVAIESSKDVD